MRKFLRGVFSGLLLVGLWFMMSQDVLAHTMPLEKTYVSMISADGNTYGRLGPGSKLGDVVEVFGEPTAKKEFKGDGIRNVTYLYDESFSFMGRTGQWDTTQANNLSIAGYTIHSGPVCTKSGFCVSTPYKKITQKPGDGIKYVSEDGETTYIYEFKGGAIEFGFKVDAAGLVRRIELRTEV